MDDDRLFSQASAEIIDLHRFFVDWFVAARADKVDFGRFEAVMGEGLTMIAPGGQILDRDAVINHVRSSRATCDDGFAISIEDIKPGWQDGDTIVVLYVEAQSRGGRHSRRQSSAVFTTSSSAPNGVQWRHLHETWLQVPEH
ncbi:DUF4440 domain-containing protein [Mesorhizobium sp. M8A.F.Ca.ET.208.01.1.1]|uniref:DUF4440 domain-containing protein n=1 Tax=unclassified Mesorhizobium TaxID=325217 RepID=UPI000FE7A4F8|nr:MULTISPECIES: DUF4440 domain-containing protein [unclassified Mesorhizobium]RWC87028.1 MAG: DUF4440 domain-containing protein [Mesorhizobium sp.]TGQ79799.1 DUF4440 domain-containing protein [Mesorhizobium sp. M8A.F.Ca.ET.207.01.1.1]TGQ91047.1 DUF4440 domain-containing protein [Mesorhizobium sp. M8A.F.Ca.ET.208.01.1.1]TGT51389.1 DUF4440 domain-containing protein [Mesorhizobium sp. M8A.F.Ca.ET.167.01.1.1]